MGFGVSVIVEMMGEAEVGIVVDDVQIDEDGDCDR
jgi:hypothetical protein